MSHYKIALELYQNQAGSENAKVKISVNDKTVAENVEISNTDSENPTLFVYDVPDLADPSEDATAVVKVELLNDFFVDTDNDRNVNWVGCGYVARNANGDYYKTFVPESDSETQVLTTITDIDWTDYKSFSWSGGCSYTGDENGTVNETMGWHSFLITATYVSATIPLTNEVAVQ
jgi:hypothetical protein